MQDKLTVPNPSEAEQTSATELEEYRAKIRNKFEESFELWAEDEWLREEEARLREEEIRFKEDEEWFKDEETRLRKENEWLSKQHEWLKEQDKLSNEEMDEEEIDEEEELGANVDPEIEEGLLRLEKEEEESAELDNMLERLYYKSERLAVEEDLETQIKLQLEQEEMEAWEESRKEQDEPCYNGEAWKKARKEQEEPCYDDEAEQTAERPAHLKVEIPPNLATAIQLDSVPDLLASTALQSNSPDRSQGSPHLSLPGQVISTTASHTLSRDVSDGMEL